MNWEGIWEFLTKFPEILAKYSTYSYVLLLLLALGGGIILVVHFKKRRSPEKGLPTAVIWIGALLIFVSLGGTVLKFSYRISENRRNERSIKEFFETYRVPDQNHWIIVMDFIGFNNTNDETWTRHDLKMHKLAEAVSEILLEDLPEAFAQPNVKRVPIRQSPWSKGVDDQNFDDIIDRLNGDELMWGTVQDEEGERVKAFVAISKNLGVQLEDTLSRRAPLKDFDFGSDPRLGLQFNPDGYSRLIGMVMLGMALETVGRAQKASGDERKAEFLKASKQLIEMQKKVVNLKEDPILSRTVYSDDVEMLLAECQREAGLIP